MFRRKRWGLHSHERPVTPRLNVKNLGKTALCGTQRRKYDYFQQGLQNPKSAVNYLHTQLMRTPQEVRPSLPFTKTTAVVGDPCLHKRSTSRMQKVTFARNDGDHWSNSKVLESETGLNRVNNHESRIRVLIVDRDEMSSDLLATRLTRDGVIQASGIRAANLLNCMASGEVQLVIIGADLNDVSMTGFDLAKAVHRDYPAAPIVMILSDSTQEAVINAFCSGARGVFSRRQQLADFLDCVDHVRKGFIWAGPQETTFIQEAFLSVPSPNMLLVGDTCPLTMRELQVVKCAASGKTNKAIAWELRLSEHTVKNYLFRAFEKLGVSNRIELLFYLTQRRNTFGNGSTGFVTDPEPASR
jgi:two-component system nitrate/nitrite response regulator NarL